MPELVSRLQTALEDRYRLEREVGAGGMATVYLAQDIRHDRRVALKWMLPALGQIKGARERFMQEASATARIAHPNIVDIYDVGSEQGSAYLVMEYLRGETLADRMCRVRLPVVDAIALLMPALRGVAAAHRHGVIHRDLKPENIFLCCTEHGDELVMHDLHDHLAGLDRLQHGGADGLGPHLVGERPDHVEGHVGLEQRTAHLAQRRRDVGLRKRATPRQPVQYRAKPFL